MESFLKGSIGSFGYVFPELTYCTLTIVAMFGTITTIALVFKK